MDIPQRVVRFDDDFKIVEFRNENGQLHRVGGPAVIEYYDGDLHSESWYKNGEPHRDNDEPGYIEYDTQYREDGNVIVMIWYKYK